MSKNARMAGYRLLPFHQLHQLYQQRQPYNKDSSC
jgi:hypothetical protein